MLLNTTSSEKGLKVHMTYSVHIFSQIFKKNIFLGRFFSGCYSSEILVPANSLPYWFACMLCPYSFPFVWVSTTKHLRSRNCCYSVCTAQWGSNLHFGATHNKFFLELLALLVLCVRGCVCVCLCFWLEIFVSSAFWSAPAPYAFLCCGIREYREGRTHRCSGYFTTCGLRWSIIVSTC